MLAQARGVVAKAKQGVPVGNMVVSKTDCQLHIKNTLLKMDEQQSELYQIVQKYL